MNNFRLLIQYDGTRYRGWQKQGNTEQTIQAKIEHTLFLLAKEEIEIHGSGRTDAGVHALGQVANLKMKASLRSAEIQEYLNRYLPQDIRILSVSEANPRFHARLNASRKHYRYQIDNGAVANIFQRKYLTRFSNNDYFYELARKQNRLTSIATGDSLQIQYDLDAMQTAAEILTGEHDFKSFCDNKKMKKSTVRTINQIDICLQNRILTLDFYGNGFLYHMVRILTGTLLEVGIGIKKPEEIPHILQAMSRPAAGFTTPPQGLFLVDVTY